MDITFPENVSIQLSSYTASYPTRTEYFLKQTSHVVILCVYVCVCVSLILPPKEIRVMQYCTNIIHATKCNTTSVLNF